MECWLEVELAATEAWAEEGTVPQEAADACRAKAAFSVEAVSEREKVTDHDVAAFVDVVAASVGEHGRWVHYGLTSSDVLDTALALQLRQAGEVVLASARAYRDALIERALEHRETLCVGRTHGVHAEPTTFGLRLAGFAFEADRNLQRLEEAFAQLRFGKLSGAVGTYASVLPAVEARVMERLGLKREDVATQVIPRDRHAVLLSQIAIAGAGLERFATEVRNLQRTEVREVEEPFASGQQKGSSAMPHKRNPIRTERITGLARVLRGYAQTGLENVGPWDVPEHLPLRRRARHPPRRDDRPRLHAGPSDQGCHRDDRAHRAHEGEPQPHPRRPLQPARPERPGRVRPDPRRGLPRGPGERPAGLGHRHAL